MAYFETSAGSSDGWEPIMWSRAVSEFGPAWANQPAVRPAMEPGHGGQEEAQ